MFYIDSYQTTMGSLIDTRPITSAIREAIVADGIDSVTLGVSPMRDYHPVFLTGYYDSEEKIRLFTHPISVFNFRNKNYLCTDLRLFITKGTSPSDIMKGVRNQTEFDFAKSRAILSMRWCSGSASSIRNTLGFAAATYATWIGQTLARAFALDYKDQTIVNVIAFAFYRGLFDNEFDISDEGTRQALAMTLARDMKVPPEFGFDVLDKLGPMSDVNALCESISKNLENLRPERFNPAILLNLIANSWFGQGAKEILSVALEHPPTWCALVYASIKQRTYKNSNIAQITERIGKRGVSDNYVMSYNNLVKEQLSPESLFAHMDKIEIPKFDL